MNNTTIEYYFQVQFNWKSNWFSENGINRPIIRASNNILNRNYVDYCLLEGFFLHTKSLQELTSATNFIERLKKELDEKGETYYGNEIVGLEIKPDFCRPIDNLGSEDGLEAPLNWNIATPEHLQYIPTEEIFQLFEDWLHFLKVMEENPPRII